LSGRLGRDAAHDLVQGATRRATESGRPVAEVLGEDQQVRAVLSDEDLVEALDPQNWLGATDALIERALAAHSRRAEEQR
jgi:3-carboxy-cis,cis-muconate cycloisomerase